MIPVPSGARVWLAAATPIGERRKPKMIVSDSGACTDS